MILDLIVVGMVLLLAIFGGWTGALVQVGRLAALLLASLFASPLASLLRPLLLEKTALPPRAAGFLAGTLAFLALVICLRFVFVFVARRLTAEGEARAIDRGTGALLGAAKAMLISWVVVSALVTAEDLSDRRWGSEGSFSAAAARSFNAFRLFLPETKEGRDHRGGSPFMEEETAYR